MKIKDIYEGAIKQGIAKDPRGKREVEEELKRAKKEFQKLKGKEKEEFDRERLTNPYSDTRILYGEPARKVKKVLVGIDIEVGELLLADRLRERTGCDLVIAHHPEGRAMATLYEVMHMQAGILHKQGLPIHIGEDLMDERIKEVERRLMPANHTRAVDVARLLDIPFMCIHTPADNCAATYLQTLFDKEEPRYVSDILDILHDIPEYKEAKATAFGPRIIVGSKKRRAGKVFVDMTGGTSGNKRLYEGLSRAGVGTIVGMHMSEDHRKEAQKHHLNVVIAGHIASDNLGMNLLFDAIFTGDVEVMECSGFRRIKRKRARR